jgi:creatinine amidohydrolase
MSEPRIWGEMTSPEIAAARDAGAVALIPIGAIEQHGPHLPVDTDISLALAAAMEAARQRPYMIVAPPVWWGLSGNHTGFAGFFTLRASTFLALLEDLCTSLVDQGFRKIALVVGHASNKPPAQMVVADVMQRRGVPIVQLNYINLGAAAFQQLRQSPPGGDWHAGELETALMMHVRPDLVKLEGAPVRYVDPQAHFGLTAGPRDIFGAGDATIGFDLAASFPDGVAGDPTVATAELGGAVFTAIVDRMCSILDEYQAIDSTKESR